MYKNAGIDIDEEWINNVTQNCSDILEEFVSVSSKVSNESVSSNKDSVGADLEKNDCKQSEEDTLDDSDTEEFVQENVGSLDTLLEDANIENRNASFTFAPGEGQRPLSIFQDKDSEYLCFPSIYCGQKRPENEERKVNVH